MDTESGYDDLTEKAEENLTRVMEGIRNAEQQGTDGTGKKKRDISMGAVERTFKAEVTTSGADRREYARAVEAAGGLREEVVNQAYGITAMVIQEDFYTLEMLRSVRASKNAGVDVIYYLGQMKPNTTELLGMLKTTTLGMF
ncbi:MAG: hypothetical protein MJ074_01805 [Oscillospiraceae bacterium]|nr:hypothetical protein [Oscillospiraceae bacterium]